MNKEPENNTPKIRPLEAKTIEQDGQKMVALYDPQNYSEMSMTVSLPAFYLMTLMDGANDAQGLIEQYAAMFDKKLEKADVLEIINKLDEAYMLENAHFRQRREEIKKEFHNSRERLPVFSGKSYPASPAELGAELDDMLDGEPDNKGEVLGIIAPHIDFRVGAKMMAAGWREIKNSDAEIFIILGTGHTLSDDFFACINKPYITPFGPMPVDNSFLNQLQENFGEDIFGQIEAHKNEHSIEFASIFWARLFGDNQQATTVPILLSFPETIWGLDHPVFNGARVDRFIQALKKTIDESGKKVVFVASVDFAHVGARFGDEGAITPDELKRIDKDDGELISAIASMDKSLFLEKIEKTNSTNRICGFPALYLLLGLCPAGSGDLLEYKQNIEGENENVVSFATMVLR